MKRSLKAFIAILMVFTVLLTHQKNTYARTKHRYLSFVKLKGNRLYYRKMAFCENVASQEGDIVGIGKTYSYKINKKTKYYMQYWLDGKFAKRTTKKKFFKQMTFNHKKDIGDVYWIDGHYLKKRKRRVVYYDDRLYANIKNKTITKLGIVQAD